MQSYWLSRPLEVRRAITQAAHARAKAKRAADPEFDARCKARKRRTNAAFRKGLSPAERKRHLAKKRVESRRYYRELPPEERARRNRRIVELRNERLAKMTPEQLRRWTEAHRAATLKWYRGLAPKKKKLLFAARAASVADKRKQLADYCVRRVLSGANRGIKGSEWPAELVEAKREELKLKRKLGLCRKPK